MNPETLSTLQRLVVELRTRDQADADHRSGLGAPCPGCGHHSLLPVSLCENVYGCAICAETWHVETKA